MDPAAVLAAFDEQIRRHPTDFGAVVERDDVTVRVVGPPDRWSGVTWSDVSLDDVDAVVRGQVDAFGATGLTWEWKYYSYDQPSTLPERLRAHGLVPGEVESLMVAVIDDLDLRLAPPTGVDVVEVLDEAGVRDMVHVHEQAFGGDHQAIGRRVLADLSSPRPATAAFVAYAEGFPVSAGRLELHAGTDFASLWGGGTIPEWRGRGLFRSLVSHRAARARAAGFRYLQVDASLQSRPILHDLGFVELATTTPFTMSARSSA